MLRLLRYSRNWAHRMRECHFSVAISCFQSGLLLAAAKRPIRTGTNIPLPSMSTQPPLPAGAEEISTAGFNLYVGPIYRLPDVRAGADGHFCFPVAEKHMNSAGSVHGGMLMSFADVAMSQTARFGTDFTASHTVSLNCDFVGPGRAGDLVEAHVRVTRRTRTIVFLSCDVVSGDRTLLVASGVWKIA